MVERWAAASFLATEKNFRRIMGWKDLWQLEAILGRKRSKMLRPCRRSRKMSTSAALQPLTTSGTLSPDQFKRRGEIIIKKGSCREVNLRGKVR
jgi:hypothetical protein